MERVSLIDGCVYNIGSVQGFLMETVTAVLPIYHRTRVDWFKEALFSILSQSRPLDEILIIADGLFDEAILATIQSFDDERIKVIQMAENKGLGQALAHGVKSAKGNLILRMDDDDISCSERLEKQLNLIQKNPEIAVCGGQIIERSSDLGVTGRARICPLHHEAILRGMRRRNTMNHVTTLFRRDAALRAGNYHGGTIGYEDYDLWFRMIEDGCRFANLDEYLVTVRFDLNQAQNRVGWRAIKYECFMQLDFWKKGYITFFVFLSNLAWRVMPRLMPKLLFLNLVRKMLRRPVT
jgi:glycosyltransferase involved in cell wall biosynthesis